MTDHTETLQRLFAEWKAQHDDETETPMWQGWNELLEGLLASETDVDLVVDQVVALELHRDALLVEVARLSRQLETVLATDETGCLADLARKTP